MKKNKQSFNVTILHRWLQVNRFNFNSGMTQKQIKLFVSLCILMATNETSSSLNSSVWWLCIESLIT